MGLKLCRETLAPGLPVHNSEANKNDRLNWKLLGGLGVTIITFSGFFIFSMYSQRTWSSGNSKLTVARYAASSNVTAGNQDAVHSASSASSSKNSWTITEVVGMVVAVVLVPAMTMGYNHYLYWRTTKDRKNENKEKEKAKEKRREEEKKKRREEKRTKWRERKELERRQEDAKDQRHWSLIQHWKFPNLDLSAKGKSEISYNSTVYERFMQDLTLRDDEASTSESKEQCEV